MELTLHGTSQIVGSQFEVEGLQRSASGAASELGPFRLEVIEAAADCINIAHEESLVRVEVRMLSAQGVLTSAQ